MDIPNWRKTVIDRYFIEIKKEIPGFQGESNPYMATIIFENRRFKDCKFSGLNQVYSLQDWEFIRVITDEIFRLIEQYKKDE